MGACGLFIWGLPIGRSGVCGQLCSKVLRPHARAH